VYIRPHCCIGGVFSAKFLALVLTNKPTIINVNSNKSSASAKMAAQCCTNQIFAFECCFSVITEIITTYHILPKSRFFRLNFYCTQYGPNFTQCDATGSKAIKFSEIMQNYSHYAVQGHSRLNYSTYLLSCTISEIWRLSGPIFAWGACL